MSSPPPLCLRPSHREKVRHSTAHTSHHRSTANFTRYFLQPSLVQLYITLFCLLFIPSSEFLHIAQTIQHLNCDPETCAGTNPFGSFRGPSQSLILSSRDRDNTAKARFGHSVCQQTAKQSRRQDVSIAHTIDVGLTRSIAYKSVKKRLEK
jgi:hypothetical protein